MARPEPPKLEDFLETPPPVPIRIAKRRCIRRGVGLTAALEKAGSMSVNEGRDVEIAYYPNRAAPYEVNTISHVVVDIDTPPDEIKRLINEKLK